MSTVTKLLRASSGVRSRATATAAAPDLGVGPTAGFSLLTWNVDGIRTERNLREEEAHEESLLVMLDEISRANPDILCLQEITPRTLPFWNTMLDSVGYTNSEGATSVWHPYFTLIFVKRPLVFGDVVRRNFETVTSNMCRDVLSVNVDIGGKKVLVITSHLESLREGSVQRKAQLLEMFQTLKRHVGPALFCGDCNINATDEKEVMKKFLETDASSASAPILDAFVVAQRGSGAGALKKTTWGRNMDRAGADPIFIEARYDRVYLNSKDIVVDVDGAAAYGLVGDSPMTGPRGAASKEIWGYSTPSDHYGVLVKLQVKTHSEAPTFSGSGGAGAGPVTLDQSQDSSPAISAPAVISVDESIATKTAPDEAAKRPREHQLDKDEERRKRAAAAERRMKESSGS